MWILYDFAMEASEIEKSILFKWYVRFHYTNTKQSKMTLVYMT
jgi:hypothetical protein